MIPRKARMLRAALRKWFNGLPEGAQKEHVRQFTRACDDGSGFMDGDLLKGVDFYEGGRPCPWCKWRWTGGFEWWCRCVLRLPLRLLNIPFKGPR